MDRRRDAGKSKTQLTNLRALPSGPPRTKTGQVLWAWPAIQASLNSGRNLREIWEALQLDGIEMSYDQFRVYVSRIRKRLADQPPAMPAPQVTELRVAEGRDPLANIRRERDRKQRSGFDFGGPSRETE
jgi:hypothetical protein